MHDKLLEWIGVSLCVASLAVMLFTEFNGLFLIFAALLIADKTNKTLNFFATQKILKWWIIGTMGITSLLDFVLAVKLLTHSLGFF